MENIAILGSTGSIGCNTLEIIEKLSHKFRVVGLAAGRNLKLFLEQVEKYKPKIVSLSRREEAVEFKHKLSDKTVRVAFGQKGAEEVARFEENDIVVSAITGIKGLRPTLAAVSSGKKVALANKESMVAAGPLIQTNAQESKAQIIPIDSEHSGIFQCLAKEKKENVKKVILTASGGPFFRTSLQDVKNKTLEEALIHPRWKMGKKVTIDSATLMNKGLELIEARWLFGLDPKHLGILIHPQSIVHSLVELRDGSVLAQLSPTDMKVPIQYALTYPHRENSILPSLNLSQIKVLEFFDVDEEKFPLIKLACLALEEGESVPVALNTANEVAVEAFLNEEIQFWDISILVRQAVEGHQKRKVETLEDIFEVDRETREQTLNLVKRVI
ncbi:MAG: 1-deoxy-D-xylulose-5-phosphate reductoisomerase [Candidatus Aminicenantaceae bacterium]